MGVEQNNPAKGRGEIASRLQTNLYLNKMLESVVGNWPMIQDAAIVDADGKAILDTVPDMIGKNAPERPAFQIVQNAKFLEQRRLIYNPPTLYEVRLPLELNQQPFGTIRVGVSTVLLRNEITQRLQNAVIFSGISIFLSLLLAAGLSYIALGHAGASTLRANGDYEANQDGLVTLKIAH
jgi:hypothetical protein